MEPEIKPEAAIRNLVAAIRDPETGRPIHIPTQLKSVKFQNRSISIQIGLTSFCAPLWDDIRRHIEHKLRSQFPEFQSFEIEVEEIARSQPPLGSIGLTAKAVIAVGSGKGGVGKSTVALMLALALKKSGCRVGLLDADVYGPSIPHLTGVRGQAGIRDGKIETLDFDGIPLMSIGFMVSPDQAVIWRGPMLHQAVTRFVRDTNWGQLDYLIVDMPPGTGDVALSLSQLVPITGAVVVCTPQEVALIDAIKAVAMFRQVKIPIAGIVENMSGFACPDCHKTYPIFGKGGAREYAEQAELPFLGEIPLQMSIRENGDSGLSADNLNHPNVGPYLDRIAYQLVSWLAQQRAKTPFVTQLPVLS